MSILILHSSHTLCCINVFWTWTFMSLSWILLQVKEKQLLWGAASIRFAKSHDVHRIFDIDDEKNTVWKLTSCSLHIVWIVIESYWSSDDGTTCHIIIRCHYLLTNKRKRFQISDFRSDFRCWHCINYRDCEKISELNMMKIFVCDSTVIVKYFSEGLNVLKKSWAWQQRICHGQFIRIYAYDSII